MQEVVVFALTGVKLVLCVFFFNSKCKKGCVIQIDVAVCAYVC